MVSKSCYKIFCDTFHSFLVKESSSSFAIDIPDDSSTENEDHGSIEEESEEKEVRFHYFDDLFEGITPLEIVKTFDEVLSDEKRGAFDDKAIEICREEWNGEIICQLNDDFF